MQKYQAKIDLALFIPVVGLMLGVTLMTVILPLNEPDPRAAYTSWGIALLMLLSTIFCAQCFLATHYLIDGKALIVHAGPLYKNRKIDIASIRKITKTRTFISAPAPSLDRLEIFYNKFDSIVISPKDKTAFIMDLLKLNPAIEVA